jgi:DNA-binding protein H-NS
MFGGEFDLCISTAGFPPTTTQAMTKTYLQVQKQIAQLQKEADTLRKKEAAGVLARIKEAITVYGFTAEELGVGTRKARASKTATAPAAKRKGAKKAAAPRFKDDQGNVWGGRGPRPAWFKAALESGKTPADLAA